MNLSIIQRFLADTPPFFKKVHAFGMVLIGIAITMYQYPIIPSKWDIIVGTIGGVLTVISQFAVNDVAALQNVTVASVPGMITDLSTQIGAVVDLVKSHPTTADLANILASQNTAAPAPIQNVVIAQPAPAAAPAASPTFIADPPPATI